VLAVAQDQPVIFGFAADRLEAKFLVEIPRGFYVLDRKTDGESAEFHVVSSWER